MIYSTVHKVKGTESDYVIILDGGPPRAAEEAGNRSLERALKAFPVRLPFGLSPLLEGREGSRLSVQLNQLLPSLHHRR